MTVRLMISVWNSPGMGGLLGGQALAVQLGDPAVTLACEVVPVIEELPARVEDTLRHERGGHDVAPHLVVVVEQAGAGGDGRAVLGEVGGQDAHVVAGGVAPDRAEGAAADGLGEQAGVGGPGHPRPGEDAGTGGGGPVEGGEGD